MTDFLGVPMSAVMVVLVVALALALASVGLVWWRNRIIFDIGLRYIPRRRAQSTLIVLGLMLSTAIIAAALSTGDTVEYSITSDTYEKLGRVDELIQVRGNDQEASLSEEQIAPPGIVPGFVVDEVSAELIGRDDVDGLLPGTRFPAPLSNSATGQTIPQAAIVGLETSRQFGFAEDFVLAGTGAFVNIGQLGFGEALVNESTQRALDLRLGDRIEVWVNRVPRSLTVVGVVEDRFLTGWTLDEPRGVLVNMETARQVLEGTPLANGYGFIAISNAGGVRDSLQHTDDVTRAAIIALASSRFEVETIKQDRIDRARELGQDMTSIFVVLGLFSIAAGLLLVFLILVMLSAERRPEMGMSRAVGMKRLQLIESFMAEGMAYSLTSALVGALLGVVVAVALTGVLDYVFDTFDVAITFHVEPRSLVIAYCLGVVLTYITVLVSAWRVSSLSIVAAIREVDEPPPRSTGLVSGASGAVMCAAGTALAIWGLAGDSAQLFGVGVSLLLLGAAFVARFFAAPERPVFTATSVAVLVLWVLVAGGNLSFLTGDLEAGIDAFFVGGVVMVAAATFVVLYNAELLLAGVRAIGVVFARAVPATRTAIAYPLLNKFRTGMTIAMLSLVVFALVMISTMSLNFRELFLGDDSRGGWDIEVSAIPTNALSEDDAGNPLGPLGEALDRAFYDTRKIEAISRVFVANPLSTDIAQLRPDGSRYDAKPFPVLGADDAFLKDNTIGLQARAFGFETDREVWDAVRDNPNYAVIDGSVVPGINYANVTESRFTLEGYESGTKTFEPFPMVVNDNAAGHTRAMVIIGIMNRAPSETYRGLWMNTAAAQDAFPALFARYYIRLAPGADSRAEADAMEVALAEFGISAESIEEQVEERQAFSTAFFYLVQGFMALGLGVGLAALGVIAFRTVVERRQQIGLMRAIGFTRTSVALTFLIESSFIAVLGIVNGVWLALLLSSRILSSDEFSTAGFTEFHVPWLQIAIMAVAVFIASVLTTLVPSRQASSVPPAEALRYE
ncbi:MAG TPA: FtsX-like permease family protein [Dehalococcoidia bacterium]|nr:FtsX-like permease family protein [Dehalococcoidia bacterium]